MPIAKGVDETVQLSVEHHGTCDDPLTALQDDRVLVAEIFCVVGVTQIDCHADVDAVFFLDHVEEGGCQLGTKMFEVVVQIREMFVAHERHLFDGAVKRIRRTERFESGDILLRSTTNLSITLSTKSGIHLVTQHFRIDTFHYFHQPPTQHSVAIARCLITDKNLRLWIGTESKPTRFRT